jgi:hypothetical protein
MTHGSNHYALPKNLVGRYHRLFFLAGLLVMTIMLV